MTYLLPLSSQIHCSQVGNFPQFWLIDLPASLCTSLAISYPFIQPASPVYHKEHTYAHGYSRQDSEVSASLLI
jgi:hypothetical protein